MDKHFSQRVKRLLNDLLPATGLESKFDPPQTLRDRLRHYHTPGVSIAAINDFEVEWARGFGVCDARFKNKVAPHTLFQAGSVSKPVFALGVMRLVQEGRLDLDEDVQHYLSSWRVPANDGWQPKITLRQLLSHTAGLTVGGFPGYQVSDSLPTTAQVLSGESPANTPKVEVNSLPGLQFRYSGGGTTVAQQVVIDLLKKPFPQIMRELVLEPLGLTHSTYEQPLPKSWAKKAATAHPWKGTPLKGRFHIYPEMAAAGLWTTAGDLAKVGVELLKVLHDRKAPALLTKETTETMLRSQLENQKVSEGERAGLGFFCNGQDDGFYFEHAGWDEGFVALMRLYKNLGQGAVVMLNSNEGYPLMEEIMHAIAKEYAWPDALPQQKPIVSLANIDDYAGLYSSKTGTQFRLSVAGNDLMLQVGQQPPLPIFPSSKVEFFARVINAKINFEMDDKAGIISMTVSQQGNQIHAAKQYKHE
jgi:CubicO group peptidase (beta-lactamase class C family)